MIRASCTEIRVNLIKTYKKRKPIEIEFLKVYNSVYVLCRLPVFKNQAGVLRGPDGIIMSKKRR